MFVFKVRTRHKITSFTISVLTILYMLKNLWKVDVRKLNIENVEIKRVDSLKVLYLFLYLFTCCICVYVCVVCMHVYMLVYVWVHMYMCM